MSLVKSPLLIRPAELQTLITEAAETLLIIDAGDMARYVEAHIPGAIHLEYDRYVSSAGAAMGLFPDSGILSQTLSEIGLRSDQHVVIYDDAGGGKAARLFYTLDCLGHEKLSYLDGGWPAWQFDGCPSAQGQNLPTASVYTARLQQPQRIYDASRLTEALQSEQPLVVDCRSPAEYSGDDVRAARGGHIPGAVNFDWTNAMQHKHERRLKPEATLRSLLEQRGITPDREVIVHCQTHHRSAHTYMLLRALGYPHVAAYPGSWSEWGNNPELPLRTGSNP